MSLPLVMVGVLMFAKIPGMSDCILSSLGTLTYIVWGTLYSTVEHSLWIYGISYFK